MDEVKSITANSSVAKISSCLQKIYQKIADNYEKKLPDHNCKEIEFLKVQCKSDNVQLGLMSCQTFVRLVEDGVMEGANVLAILLSILPNCNPIQCTYISESVISLLLLGLKHKVHHLQPGEKYQCPYGLKVQQHPMIALLQNPSVNMNDMALKISSITNHHDRQIKDHSLEYLRPVLFYILCNPQAQPEVKAIWTSLLALMRTQPEAKVLICEILSWSKISNSTNCLLTSTLLIEAIEHFLQQKSFPQAYDLCIYQALVVKSLVSYGIDPRPSLHCLLRALYALKEHIPGNYDVLTILLAENIHVFPPVYLKDLLQIIAFIVVQKSSVHEYVLNMCLDGVLQWMSHTTFISTEGMQYAHQIMQQAKSQGDTVTAKAKDATSPKEGQANFVRYLHPDIAIAFDLAKLVESFDDSEIRDVFSLVDSLNAHANPEFCQRQHLFLRAMFLSRELSMDCWFKLYEVMLNVIQVNSSIAYGFQMTYIYKLAGEQNPEIELELLRGLPRFGVCKDNIPIILNIIRNLASDNSTLCLDLYLRLWRVEARTYPFFIKFLAQPYKQQQKSVKHWEFEVAKTHTIREICLEKPTQHGSDLVSHLSDILNTCTDEAGDLPTSLAIDAIVALCDSHTINITSTWRVLSSKFRNERRPQTLKSLLRFFAHVPLLHTPTVEFEKLVEDALDQIFLTIFRSDSPPEMIREALAALQNYEIGTLLTLRHIPSVLRQDLNIPHREYTNHSGREVIDLQEEAIPGEVWVHLLQRIRPDCAPAAADLVAHHIYAEISGYRSGVYYLAEGKPEPRKLAGLFAHSPLKAIVSYLVNQSRFGNHIGEPMVVTNALRAISRKFPKPIPPLDWCFLHSFFHLSFEARKYCILIAKNQLLHSGTARRLIENFLNEFEPNCFEEDLLLLLTLLPEFTNGVSLGIIKSFAEKVVVYCFKESQMCGFVEGCLFEKFLDSVKRIFSSKCDIPEVLDIFTLLVERYMDSMDMESRLFERYTEVVAVLHPNAIDSLTSPANWWETPLGKLKKATIIRCYLVLYNTQLPNPLKWITPIIDAYHTRRDERPFFFRHLSATLYAFKSDEHACAWTVELFIHIQALLAEAASIKEKLDKALYLLDVFILAVDVLSGCAILLGNLDIVAMHPAERFEIFPESMQYLCDHVFWKDQEAKIYEFLYTIYKNSLIPNNYSRTFRNAIICSRNKAYFENKGTWTKYLGIRK